MRIDVRQSDHDRAATNAAREDGRMGAGDPHEPPLWIFGSRVATQNVQTARKAYLLYAEFAERSVNGVVSASTRAGKDLWAVASRVRGARATMHERDTAYTTPIGASGGRKAAFKRKLAQGRSDVRDIALRGQIATDDNMRAYLDHLDDLAKAPSASAIVSVQTSYIWDQWQRSARQAIDLQRRTVDALQNITSTPTA